MRAIADRDNAERLADGMLLLGVLMNPAQVALIEPVSLSAFLNLN
jgi:hypothetical protein